MTDTRFLSGILDRFRSGARGRRGLAVGMVVVLSCATDTSTAPTYTAVDSAGVALVVSHRPAWKSGEGWTLEAQPSFQVGIVDGDPLYELYEVTAIEFLSDGTVAIVNASSGEVRLFDHTGRAVGRMGQPGGGPGEFTRLMGLAVTPGDTLLAMDWDGSLAVFTRDGALVREETRPSAIPREIFLVHPRADGTYTGIQRYRQPEPPVGIHRAPMDLVRVDRDSVVAVYGPIPNLEQEWVLEGGGRTRIPPFAKSSTYAATARSDWVVTGDNDQFDVHVYDLSGTLVRRLRLDSVEVAVSEADLEAWKEARREFAGTPDGVRGLERDWAEMAVPETMPAFSNLVLGPEGEVWVGRYDPAAWGARRFSVFDPQGIWLGDVDVPEGLLLRGTQVAKVTDDFFFGVWVDDLGVEQVRGYRILKP